MRQPWRKHKGYAISPNFIHSKDLPNLKPTLYLLISVYCSIVYKFSIQQFIADFFVYSKRKISEILYRRLLMFNVANRLIKLMKNSFKKSKLHRFL